MLEKVKRARNVFAIIAAAALAFGLGLTALALVFTLRESYTPLWFIIPISFVCYYAALILGFFALDRASAHTLLLARERAGTSDTEAIAREMGWKIKPTEKLLNKCKKWGYID